VHTSHTVDGASGVTCIGCAPPASRLQERSPCVLRRLDRLLMLPLLLLIRVVAGVSCCCCCCRQVWQHGFQSQLAGLNLRYARVFLCAAKPFAVWHSMGLCLAHFLSCCFGPVAICHGSVWRVIVSIVLRTQAVTQACLFLAAGHST
jgi:hypothetical protein